MPAETFSTIRMERDGPIRRVVLCRPDVRNAFDETMIAELTSAFHDLSSDADARVVILSGDGKIFCAGADVHWMRRAASYSREENLDDARRMAAMLRTIDTCARPVVGQIRGAAIGGGVGLAAVCDIVVASENTVFSLAEVKLGILPAAISPYVLRAIGARQARDCFLTGDRFGAEEARRIGLAHQVVADDGLEAAVANKVASLLTSGPESVAAAKALIEKVSGLPIDEAFSVTSQAIADRRASDEGKEGLTAFLEKRKPAWSAKS